jgi:hypothetical protein
MAFERQWKGSATVIQIQTAESRLLSSKNDMYPTQRRSRAKRVHEAGN